MIADVKAGEFLNSALFHRLFRSPVFIRVNEFSELSAVVAEVIYSHGVITEKFEDTIKRAADDGGGQMPYVEGLCDIDR